MADGADAADARCNARHFVIGPALDEFLEPADLGYLELGIGNLAVIVQFDGDFARDPQCG